MSAKDRLFEKKFAKFMAMLPKRESRGITCYSINGRLHCRYVSDAKTPAGRRIDRLIGIRIRARE